jgi:hypothetical protein
MPSRPHLVTRLPPRILIEFRKTLQELQDGHSRIGLCQGFIERFIRRWRICVDIAPFQRIAWAMMQIGSGRTLTGRG